MEWIKVSERLPKENNDYLVCDYNYSCTVASFRNGEWEVFPEFWSKEYIYYWMPLPKRPNK